MSQTSDVYKAIILDDVLEKENQRNKVEDSNLSLAEKHMKDLQKADELISGVSLATKAIPSIVLIIIGFGILIFFLAVLIAR